MLFRFAGTNEPPAGLHQLAATAGAGRRIVVPAGGDDPNAGDTTLPSPVIGFQVALPTGENIQGDADDPSGLPSYAILDAASAETVMRTYGTEGGLALQMIFAGDIEEPAFVVAEG